jgi:site-specific recombinase XerD
VKNKEIQMYREEHDDVCKKTNTNSFKVLMTRLLALLEAESYSENTIKNVKCILRTMSNYLEMSHLKDYSPEIGNWFVTYCVKELHISPSYVLRIKNVIGKLNRLQQGLDGRAALLPDMSKKFKLPNSLKESLDSYLTYCVDKGNRQTTINTNYLLCGRFLENLSDMGYTEIHNVTGEHVQTAFLAMGFTRYWERIGPFLCFLYDDSILEHNYSRLIRRRRNPIPQPTVYFPEEIRCVEDSFNLSSPSGIRNYAIMLLLTRYGIRSCDVAALTFDKIDFEKDRLHFIQQKTDDTWEIELLPEVKMALQNYIENIRPNFMKCRNVFITLIPPYTPINDNTINSMIQAQFRHIKFDIAGRKHGSRAFRSSVASNMINDGVSTEVVRKVLGHGTKHALKHYAKIDMESMRLCPLSVPEPAGVFAEILTGRSDITHV